MHCLRDLLKVVSCLCALFSQSKIALFSFFLALLNLALETDLVNAPMTSTSSPIELAQILIQRRIRKETIEEQENTCRGWK